MSVSQSVSERSAELEMLAHLKMYNKLDKKRQNLPIDEFKTAIQKQLKPPRYKHYNTGSKLGCALMSRIKVGRSFLDAHSHSIGLAPENTCKCNDRDQETPLYYITNCRLFTEQRSSLFQQIEQFIPNFRKLAKRDNMKSLCMATKLIILS